VKTAAPGGKNKKRFSHRCLNRNKRPIHSLHSLGGGLTVRDALSQTVKDALSLFTLALG
jgi:hypothetical protein